MPFPPLQPNSFKFSQLKLGQQVTCTVEITHNLVKEFSNFTGDRNPIHVSEKEAKKSIFKRPVAHGFLVSSFLSSIYANLLPGEGSILLDQDLQYIKPVFIGDEVKYQVEISEIYEKKKIIELRISCLTNQKVIEGRASILLLNL